MKRNLTEKEFMDLRKGAKVYVRIGENFYYSEVLRSAFYNPDAEEPGWEIETTQGYCDNNSLYIETEPPAHCLLVYSDGYSIEYTDYPNIDLAIVNMKEAYYKNMPSNLSREWKEMSYISDRDRFSAVKVIPYLYGGLLKFDPKRLMERSKI